MEGEPYGQGELSHALNVAMVSAGIAIELIYKGLSGAEVGAIVKKHQVRALHNAIRPETKREIETIVSNGWHSTKLGLAIS